MLSDEHGTATNIKSRTNRLSVTSAITSAQQRLKLYSKVPPNGLVIYTGAIVTEDGKDKRVNIDFEPFRPINTSVYLCDNKFHTESLKQLLTESDRKYGFIVMDGNGTLFGTLCGNTSEVLHRLQVHLPKKHGHGGQSALRFARLRAEKRHNYVRKVAELGTALFITNDRANVAGVVLAGSADFKTELGQSEMFDPRLQALVLGSVDVSYGGENGFKQAIDLSAEMLDNVKLMQEKRLIQRFFEQISMDTGRFVFSVKDTMQCLEMGAVDTLVVWEELDCDRYELYNSVTNRRTFQLKSSTCELHFKEGGVSLEVQSKTPLTEWLAANYKSFGCTLEFVTNKSHESSQFCRGFGGIGGILRYQVNLEDCEADVSDAPDENDDDDDGDW
ncbi:Ethylene-responsive transcription factor 13 [Pleodorina starrii]|uniref:Eukaryotic peptide chain release factor subunit 1 n=1 Tax=Pleodorina starrii TaxID=330485 RepID=A0A9W6BLY4_9CHLO|nr:Ethylene-responsive transcription factor 13 [Pleodorina starrii]